MLGAPTSSSEHDRKPSSLSKDKQVGFDLSSNTYRFARTHKVNYQMYNTKHADPTLSSLVDRGANRSIAGSDIHVHWLSDRKVNVTGIENHQMPDLHIGTFLGMTKSNYGDILVVLHQYAYHGQGKTIHSSPQMEAFGITVDDKSIKAGGTQTITAHHGFVLPLDIKDGLPYMLLRPQVLEKDKLFLK